MSRLKEFPDIVFWQSISHVPKNKTKINHTKTLALYYWCKCLDSCKQSFGLISWFFYLIQYSSHGRFLYSCTLMELMMDFILSPILHAYRWLTYPVLCYLQELEKILFSAPLPEPKYQLRRTGSATFWLYPEYLCFVVSKSCGL